MFSISASMSSVCDELFNRNVHKEGFLLLLLVKKVIPSIQSFLLKV